MVAEDKSVEPFIELVVERERTAHYSVLTQWGKIYSIVRFKDRNTFSCDCQAGSLGKRCSHVEWLCRLINAEVKMEPIIHAEPSMRMEPYHAIHKIWYKGD